MNKPTNSTFVKHTAQWKIGYYKLRMKMLKALLPKRMYVDSCTITGCQHEWTRPGTSFTHLADTAARKVGHKYPDYWKLKVALWAAKQAMNHHPGSDLVECGVHKGYISTALLLAGIPSNSTFYLCDCWDIGCYDSSWEQVQKTFEGWNNVKLIRGYMPEAANEIQTAAISYLYLDMNDGQVELDTLNKLWPQLCRGAIILLDDYCFPGFEDSMAPWRKASLYNILPLPTGQGMIIK